MVPGLVMQLGTLWLTPLMWDKQTGNMNQRDKMLIVQRFDLLENSKYLPS